ncbi:cytochrome P450 [Mycena sp. CBHHK59/15]|nr:cytochrome P450 [Mycena sp. CBHHK59/15]
MIDSLTTLDITFAILGVFLLKHIMTHARRAPLPPGPRPILGVLALPSPSDKEWLTYGKWADTWGDITSVSVFSQPLIVLNSFKLATELLDKKSSIYSDRPVFQMSGELVGWKKGMALLYYGTPHFRRSRKYFHQLFGSPVNMARFHPIEADENRKFLQRLLESPKNFLSHIRQTASAVVMRITYGYIVKSEDDSILSLVNSVMDEFFVSIAPGAFLVDLIPMLKYVPSWMPGAGFQRKAKTWSNHLTEMIEQPLAFAQDQMAQGLEEDSFVSLLLRDDPLESEVDSIKWTAGSIYGGGADTTVSAISTFFLNMTLHPDIQAKAQAEIDAVVGTHRLPTYADRENFPYVEALCKEVFRYHPIGPMGLPHRVMEDNICKGYLIPKGSIWRMNMTHNPEVYADPMTFNPSRFIASDGHIPEPDPQDVVFGFGVCKLLADTSVFLSCAMALATFTISKAVQDGTTVEPVENYLPGTVSHPAPFLCSIKPRSAETVALISIA